MGLFDPRDCQPGDRVEMDDGTIVLLSEDFSDGVWLIGRAVGSDGELAGESTFMVDEVRRIIRD